MDQGSEVDTNALNLRWSWGFNNDTPDTVHNLSSSKHTRIFTASSHTGVIYDQLQNHQFLLQGHRNVVTASCLSQDKTWLVTGDEGDVDEGGIIIVWDTRTAVPSRIFEVDSGILSLDLSSDGTCIVALTRSSPQQVLIYEWTEEAAEPIAVGELPQGFPIQHHIRFNTVDVCELVSTGDKQVVYWQWNNAEVLEPVHPTQGTNKFTKAVGLLTQSVFIPYTSKAITATTRGDIILWDYPSGREAECREAIKMIKTGNEGSVNVLQTVDKYIVTGGQDGCVRFYDFQFRVVGWFEDINAGEIISISFAESTLPSTAATAVATGKSLETFSVPDFIVGTSKCRIIECDVAMMNHPDVARRKGRLIMKGIQGATTCVDSHPSFSLAAVGTSLGELMIWNFHSRKVVVSKRFPAPIQALRFSPTGHILAVGFTKGGVELVSTEDAVGSGVEDEDLDAASRYKAKMDTIEAFRPSKMGIVDLQFSDDGTWLASADMENCVGVYRYSLPKRRGPAADMPTELKWNYIGRYRSHTAPITGLVFAGGMDRVVQRQSRGKKERVNYPRLFSVGEDAVLHEYDLRASSVKHGIKIKSSTIVEDKAAPSCLFWSALPDLVGSESKDTLALVCVSDSYKFKVMWNGTPQQRNRLEEVLAAEKRAQQDEDNDNDEHDGENGDDGEHNNNSNNSKDGGDNDGSDSAQAQPSSSADVSGNVTPRQQSSSSPTTSKQMLTNPESISITARVVLGPTYGGPVNKLVRITPDRRRQQESKHEYCAYSTEGQVIGLVQLPLDGNPERSMATIAHPGEVSSMSVSCDGKYLITCGGPDGTVKLWAVTTTALEASIVLAEEDSGSDAFAQLLEGGKQGQFYKELVDYFYYCQLRHQGMGTSRPRRVTGFITQSEAVKLMMGLGVYLSEKQIRDLLCEMELLSSSREGITLDEFIQLYWNHRPVEGLDEDEIKAAFDLLGTDGVLTGEELVDTLQNAGERMTEEEIVSCLKVLVPQLDIPDTITSAHFAHSILGLEQYAPQQPHTEDQEEATQTDFQ